MEVVYRTIIQLTLVSRVIAMSFENIIKSLPADIPGEFKSIMLDLYMKNPKEFDMAESDLEGMAHTESAATPHDYRKKNNVVVKKLTATKTKPGKKAAVKIIKVTNKPKIVRSDTLAIPLPSEGATTPAEVTAAAPTAQPHKSVAPPPMMAQIPVPVPMPLPIPMYPRVPIMMPMKSFFEPVIHDHPPLYEIQDLIRADKKRWKNQLAGKDSETSMEKRSDSDDSDTDTDTSSDEIDIGSDYYDTFIRIKA